MSEANIEIPVDLTNPGQFFACCGLLELADRLWPGAEVAGWLELHRFDRATFRVVSTASFTSQVIVAALCGCRRTAVDPFRPIRGSDGKPVKDAEKTKPIHIGAPIDMRMAWWLDELEGRQTAFKLWGARVTSLSLFDDAVAAIDPANALPDKLFTAPVGMSGRFGFDIRSSWDTLNTGYSPNDQSEEVESYPAVELLAAVGLQNFRPVAVGDDFVFTTWSQSLPTMAARAASAGVLGLADSRNYRFTVLSRGKFKSFSKAQLLPRSPNV
jgi:CRISPR-associated protein Csx14